MTTTVAFARPDARSFRAAGQSRIPTPFILAAAVVMLMLMALALPQGAAAGAMTDQSWTRATTSADRGQSRATAQRRCTRAESRRKLSRRKSRGSGRCVKTRRRVQRGSSQRTMSGAGPTVTLTTRPAGSTTDTSATFAWTTTSKVSSTSCSLDGAAFAACASPKVLTGLAVGSHSFAVRVSSKSGSATARATWTVTAPSEPAPPLPTSTPTPQPTPVSTPTPQPTPGGSSPTVSLAQPTEGQSLAGTVRLDAVAAGASAVRYIVDGVEVARDETCCDFSENWTTTTVADGAHAIRAIAVTPSGQVSSQPVGVKVANAATGPAPAPPSGSPSFSDEFNGAGAPDALKWRVKDACDRWGSVSCNSSRSNNVALDGQGNLRVTAIREPWTDSYGSTGTWTAARIESRFSQLYGTWSARIKVPAGTGLWPSFWTTSTVGAWPNTGEIDVMEILGDSGHIAKSYCSAHGADALGQHVGVTKSYTAAESLANAFHVFTARWAPGQIEFSVDGQLCAAIPLTGLQAFTQQDVKLGMAVGGSWPGPPDGSTPSPATMLVDWVRVYPG